MGTAGLDDLKIGSSQVDKVYQGGNLVWPSGVVFKGAVTDTNASSINNITLDLSGTVSTGDLVYIAISSDSTLDGTAVTISGMTTVQPQQYSTSSPGFVIAYGFFQSGDSTTITFSTASNNGNNLTAIAAVFGNVTAFQNTTGQFGTYGTPNPPSLAAGSATELLIISGHQDDDNYTMTSPSGYTMAASLGYGSSGNATTTGVGYKITNVNVTENPSSFGGSGDDRWFAFTLRFS